jgi:polysaccharide biosynthesis protein PslG
MNMLARPLARILLSLVTLALFASTASHGAVAAPAVLPLAADATSPFGLNTHLATRYPNFQTIGEPLALAGGLGVGWAREDFAWPRIEPRPDRWDWGFTDKMVAGYGQHNVQILGRLGYSVGWATADPNDPNDGQSFAMPDLGAWRDYIATTVRRYKGSVRHWEIWNEPDNPIYWSGRPDPQAYAQLLRVAHDTIKGIDPGAKVLIGGVSPFDLAYLEGIARAGAWNAFDILAIHPYVDPASPEQGQIGPSGVGGVRALLNRHGPKPIWATEFGWESGASPRNPGGRNDEDAQASFMVRGYIQLLAEQGMERAFWYTMHDDRDSSFGLFRFGGGYADYSSPKPARNAFTTMARELAGARFQSTVDVSSDRREVESWEGATNWVQAGPANGTLVKSAERARSGGHAGRYDYRFPSGENDYVAFRPPSPLAVGRPSTLGLWVYGDNSGHLVQVQLEDQTGEVLQFALGKVGGPEWSWMQASLSGEVLPGNRLGGGDNNGRLDGEIKVRALVVDDQPNEYGGSGTIWIDDLTASSGPEVYAYRWQRGVGAVDVVFAPAGANVRIPTASATARIVERDGAASEIRAEGGYLTIWADGRPRYLHHTPGVAQTQPTPEPQPQPGESFVPAPPSRMGKPVARGCGDRRTLARDAKRIENPQAAVAWCNIGTRAAWKSRIPAVIVPSYGSSPTAC